MVCNHTYAYFWEQKRFLDIFITTGKTMCIYVVIERGRDNRAEKEREMVKWRGTEERFGLKRDIRDWMTCHHYICFNYCLLLLSWGCLASIHLNTPSNTRSYTHKHSLSRTICPHGSFVNCPYLYTEINGTNSTHLA